MTMTHNVTVTATETIRNARGGIERHQAAQVFDDGESVATFSTRADAERAIHNARKSCGEVGIDAANLAFEVQAESRVANLSPNEAWEIYVGADSVSTFAAEELAPYVASAQTCEDLDEDERAELLDLLRSYHARHAPAEAAAAEIVATGAVVLETMPSQHRASHAAAGNCGAYPANGAARYIVGREAAEALVAADEWARIVRPAKATDVPHYTMDISGEQAEAEA